MKRFNIALAIGAMLIASSCTNVNEEATNYANKIVAEFVNEDQQKVDKYFAEYGEWMNTLSVEDRAQAAKILAEKLILTPEQIEKKALKFSQELQKAYNNNNWHEVGMIQERARKWVYSLPYADIEIAERTIGSLLYCGYWEIAERAMRR